MRFAPGDRIQIIISDRPDRLSGAIATILHKDRRVATGYHDCWEAWPDDETLCNPGPDYKSWCVQDDNSAFNLIERPSVEELLTSERRAWREEGQRRLREERIGGLMSSSKTKRNLGVILFIIVVILLAWAGFMAEQADFEEWKEEKNPDGSYWEYQMDWKWQNSW